MGENKSKSGNLKRSQYQIALFWIKTQLVTSLIPVTKYPTEAAKGRFYFGLQFKGPSWQESESRSLRGLIPLCPKSESGER